MELVKIAKHGEPDISVLPEHVEAHIALGWKVVEEQEDKPKPTKGAKAE